MIIRNLLKIKIKWTLFKPRKNFCNQKLEIKINKDVKNNFSDGEAETELEKPEMGFLFGAAYENTYIDILGNKGIVNDKLSWPFFNGILERIIC